MSPKVVKGKVVLMRKYVPETISSVTGLVGNGINLIGSSLEYDITESVVFKLISRKDGPEKVGKDTHLENNASVSRSLGGKEEEFDIYFEWDDSEMGTPGAFYVKNLMKDEFFLVSMTLDYPISTCDHRKDKMIKIHFVCNSWVHNSRCYKTDRIFFDNNPYLPGDTPEALRKLREEELVNLRGDGTGEREKWDRIYDYDVYNDLGYLVSDEDHDHPILGGTDHPYPRRVRTGRKHILKNGGKYEKPAEGIVYVPRDENFSQAKTSDFLGIGLKSLSERVEPLLLSLYLKVTPNEFNCFEEVQRMYEEGGIKFPQPQVIKASRFAWMTDEEFAREMIAGVNPNVIRLLKEEDLAPRSTLDCKCNHSTITKEKLEINMGGVTVDEAFGRKRLFVLDYHDAFMPYLRKINELDSAKAYATRTFLFLKDDGTLKPLAIELSKPHHTPIMPAVANKDVESTIMPSTNGKILQVLPNPIVDVEPNLPIIDVQPHPHPPIIDVEPVPYPFPPHQSQVVLPADKGGAESTIWLLAKAHVIVNDTNYHQLISHWLHTHAVMEPFAIATHRNLSVLHPIYKLLHPHFRDTININGLARQSLISAGTIIEQTFLLGKYSVKMSSDVYKNWVFPEQALPNDLIKRGLAVKDHSAPHGLRLLIKDYPYAVDGLEIWDAIKTWVHDYVNLYYSEDKAVRQDTELQAWWKEAVKKGHADLKDKPWWPKMQTCQELIDTCTIIIWIASALHAAVNFGQYPYGGLILNRPTQSRRWIPEEGTKEYDEMVKNPQEAYLRTITPKYQTVVDLSVIEILSTHAVDEVYLGQRDNPNWTSDQNAQAAFERFRKTLAEIETKILERNQNQELKNRTGPAKLPYTVLLPTSEKGLTFRGIPNSVSI